MSENTYVTVIWQGVKNKIRVRASF